MEKYYKSLKSYLQIKAPRDNYTFTVESNCNSISFYPEDIVTGGTVTIDKMFTLKRGQGWLCFNSSPHPLVIDGQKYTLQISKQNTLIVVCREHIHEITKDEFDKLNRS
jgi:hypothetical protein